ncbi:hypothetical protein LEMLEM_LOCUS6982, partial [Lemmus lemmus]
SSPSLCLSLSFLSPLSHPPPSPLFSPQPFKRFRISDVRQRKRGTKVLRQKNPCYVLKEGREACLGGLIVADGSRLS